MSERKISWFRQHSRKPLLWVIILAITILAVLIIFLLSRANYIDSPDSPVFLTRTDYVDSPDSAHADRLYEAQLAEDIKIMLLQHIKIESALVIVSVSDASASVILTLANDEELTNQDVNIIAEIIKGSVPGITDEGISITDSNLNYYSIGNEDTE